MSNVLGDNTQQQVLALGRLGWSLRRIEEATAVRRETASAYLKAAGSQIRKARVLRQTVLGRRLALSHVPIKDDGSWDLNLHGHIHNNYRIADPKWVNLSVEVRRYRPVRLGSLVKTSHT